MNTNVKITLKLKIGRTGEVAEFTEYVSRETAYRVQAEFYKKCLNSSRFKELNELIVEDY